MAQQLVVRFLDHHMFVDRETGLAPGYKPALIGRERASGFVIDEDRLRGGQRAAIIKAEIRIPLGGESIDVSSHLAETPEGEEWLRTLQERYQSFCPVIEATTIPFTPLNYNLYRADIFKEDPGFRRVPKGILKNSPESALYLRLLPCVKDKSGEWLRPIYYKRMVGGGATYSIQELRDPLRQAEGALLGQLTREDFEYFENEREVEFPIRHHLCVSYPVAISEAHKVNALSLEIHQEV